MSPTRLPDPFAPCPNWLLCRREVSSTAKNLYARLLQYQAGDGNAWPSYDTLASEIGISRRQAINVLKELERHGLVKVTRRRNRSNIYQLPPHPWAKAAGEKISPHPMNPVKPTAPSGEGHCIPASE